MRALVVQGPGAAAAVADLPEPVPGPGEVLVEVAAAGICGSDLELLEGSLEPALADVAPGAGDVGPDLDVHGVRSFQRRGKLLTQG